MSHVFITDSFAGTPTLPAVSAHHLPPGSPVWTQVKCKAMTINTNNLTQLFVSRRTLKGLSLDNGTIGTRSRLWIFRADTGQKIFLQRMQEGVFSSNQIYTNENVWVGCRWRFNIYSGRLFKQIPLNVQIRSNRIQKIWIWMKRYLVLMHACNKSQNSPILSFQVSI